MDRHPTEFPGWERAVDDPFEKHNARHKANGYHPAIAAVLAALDVRHDVAPPMPLDEAGTIIVRGDLVRRRPRSVARRRAS